ncbi:MAG: ROK family protein [Chitinophagaceae bacterium]
MEYAIGIDLGGTRIKAVLMNLTGNIIEEKIVQTHDSGNNDGMEWKQAILEIVNEFKNQFPFLSIGISAPGLPNENNEFIAHMPGRMQGIEGFHWGSFLNQNVYVLNDGIAALMAESKFGVAKGKKHVVMLTLGTGVGGAILIEGKPYQGAFNKAGHIGHMVIDHSGDADVTGMPGSLEECIGDCTILKRSKGKYSSTKKLLDDLIKGNDFANQIWQLSVKQLALGLASVTNILSPEMIVLGGGITNAGELLFDPLNSYMEQFEWRAGGNKVQIAKAMFGEIAGTIGAASYALDKDTSRQ